MFALCSGVAVPARADSNESLNIVGFRGIRRAHCNRALDFMFALCSGVAVPARADSDESLNIVGFRGICRAHCNPAVIFIAPWHNRLLGGRCGMFGNPKGGNAMECLLLTETL
ncbi:uncharacterized protein LOC144168886 [Haemaphysalis longicornis]